MGWEPASTAVVEDSPVGVEAAMAAGMTALGYARETDAEVLASAGASSVFSDMAELPSLLSGRPA